MKISDQVNNKQLEAIKTIQGPVMVIAGPGSGKTRVLTFRIAHLIEIGVPSYQILALTFTNKAANEMKERITNLVHDKSRYLWMGTFHSVFARILRLECEKIGYGKNFSIYDTQDSVNLIKNVMNDMGIPTQRFNPRAILSRISGAKNQLVTPDTFQEQSTDIFEEKTAKIWQEYQRRMKQNNAMDFDDLLLKPIELLKHNKKILEAYQDRFRFILIDEYQDTNHAQYVLINLLAQKYRNICVVGDDAQSIYAFRGADIRNILEFEKGYPDLKTIRLEQNYRSSKNILQAADGLIKNNQDQISKNLWTDNTNGDKITVLECHDDNDEGGMIAKYIFEESGKQKLQFKDFAVMYRTNAQSRAIEDAMRKNSIPYSIIGGIEFYQRKEVKDVLAYLRLLVNPTDDESFLRIINFPSRGIGTIAIKHLKDYADKNSIRLLNAAEYASDITGISTKGKNSLVGLASMFKKYQKLRDEISISEMSRALVDEIGILSLLKEENTPESMSRWENIQELLSAVTEFAEKNSEPTLENFLQDVALVSDVDQWEDQLNSVTLMTLHSAKGLEFPVVFISGLEEGLLPFYSTDLDRKSLEEERRLMYVGVTRAMKNLYLTYSKVRFRFGEISYQSSSRFLEEIDSSLVEIKKQREKYFVSKTPKRKMNVTTPTRTGKKQVSEYSKYFSDEMPDYESATEEKLKTGSAVEHELFGKGRILQISGAGESLKAVVDFQSVGRKNLMLKYARLKIL